MGASYFLLPLQSRYETSTRLALSGVRVLHPVPPIQLISTVMFVYVPCFPCNVWTGKRIESWVPGIARHCTLNCILVETVNVISSSSYYYYCCCVFRKQKRYFRNNFFCQCDPCIPIRHHFAFRKSFFSNICETVFEKCQADLFI